MRFFFYLWAHRTHKLNGFPTMRKGIKIPSRVGRRSSRLCRPSSSSSKSFIVQITSYIKHSLIKLFWLIIGNWRGSFLSFSSHTKSRSFTLIDQSPAKPISTNVRTIIVLRRTATESKKEGGGGGLDQVFSFSQSTCWWPSIHDRWLMMRWWYYDKISFTN